MTTVARLVPVALTVAFLQAAVVDQLRWPVVTNIDLPLTLALLVITVRPDRAPEIGFVVGLMVDLLHTRLFGLHALAFAAMGSAGGLAVFAGPRVESVRTAVAVAAQALLGSTIVVIGAWLGGATARPDLARIGAVAQTVVLATVSVLWIHRTMLWSSVVADPGIGPGPGGRRPVPLGSARNR